MARKVVLEIEVNDEELALLNQGLNDLGAKFKVVEKNSRNVKKSVNELGLSSKVMTKLDQLTGGWASNIADVALGFRDVAAGINLSKTALISTGIGAIVVLLGTVVAYWDDIKNYIFDINEELEAQKQLTDQINLSLERRNQLESDNARFLDVRTKERLLRAKAEGASQSELTKIQREGLEERLALAEQYAKEADRIFAQSLNADQEAFDAAQKNQIKAYDDLAKARTALGFFDLEQQVPQDGGGKRRRESKINPLTGEDIDAENERLSRIFRERFNLDQENKNALLQSAEEANNAFLTSELVAQAQRNKIEEDGKNYRIWLAEEEAKYKSNAYMLAANGFAAASELMGRETAAGKAFAVAATLASTYQSAQLAYQSQLTFTPDAPIRAAIAATTAVVSGLANVKNILAVKVPGQGGGGSIGGGSPSRPPSFNVVANNPQNQLNQSLLEQNNRPVEAFVVDKPMTTAQELRRNKIQSSSI